MGFLTAAELKQHSGYESTVWPLQPTQKGHAEVAQDRGGPFKLYWEIHGSGDKHIIWIAGFAATHTMWQTQTSDFGHDRSSEYSSLVFDNRGIGKSDKPLLRYTTSEMARDVVDLLDHVGWTKPRSVHVCGSSLGGMIAQELALLIPDRIASLNFIATAAKAGGRSEDLSPPITRRLSMFLPKSQDASNQQFREALYTEPWLSEPDQVLGFPKNGDRETAGFMFERSDKTPFPMRGFLCQAMAGFFHQKSPAQITQIANEIGIARIQVIHGAADTLIGKSHASSLAEWLSTPEEKVQLTIFDNVGHGLHVQARQQFLDLITTLVDRSAKLTF